MDSIPLSSHTEEFKKASTAPLFGGQCKRNDMEKKPSNSLVVSLRKAVFYGRVPFLSLCSRAVHQLRWPGSTRDQQIKHELMHMNEY